MWYIRVGLIYEILNIMTKIVECFAGYHEEDLDAMFGGDPYEGRFGEVAFGILFRIVAWPYSMAYTCKICYDFYKGKES